MTVENISWSISTKECCLPRRGLNPQPPGLQLDGASKWATEAGLVRSTFLPSIIRIFQSVFYLQSGHKINGLSLSNITKGGNTESKKGPVLHFYQVLSKYSKGYSSYRADMKSFSNKTKGDKSKSKTARVVNLVCYMLCRPDLHFYQVSSKYSKGHSSYRADKKFYAYADTNGIHSENNMSPSPHLW